jgi:hypothetical protein
MRKAVFIVLMWLMMAGLSVAQIPTSGNVFFGYSYYNSDLSSADRSNSNGWEASLEGKVLPFVGIVADFSGHYGSQTFLAGAACPVVIPNCVTTIAVNANFSENNVLFGPRVSFSVRKFRPFAEAEFGVGHINANAAGTNTSFATALGGGLDYRLIRLIAWRFQGDYVQTRFFGTTQNNVQLSTGIVLHF